MNLCIETSAANDAELVALCRSGDREAFALIIKRYQSLICAITYNACGNAGRSEELAQDTFVTAWRGLGGLQEPAKLKSWLCGIARNLVQNFRRRDRHTPTALAEPLSPEHASDRADPQEQAVTSEEEQLVWQSLAAIPPDYREPMILYYREGQSAQAVAAALDLTEDAVWQRLSRGRTMLRDGVAKKIETTLNRSRPGAQFPAAVLAALPVAGPGKLATLGAAAAKGGAVKTLAAAGTWLGWLGVFGLGIQAQIENTKSPRERSFVLRRLWGRLALGAVMGMVLATFAITTALPPWLAYPMIQDAVMAVAFLGLAIYSVGNLRRHYDRRRQIQIEDGTWDESEWATQRTPRDLLPAPGPGARAGRLNLLIKFLGAVVLVLFAIQSAREGSWTRAAIIGGLAVAASLRGLWYLRWGPRFDARPVTEALGVGLCGTYTLIFYNLRHLAVWSGRSAGWPAVAIFNLAVVLAYAVFIAVLRRQARNAGGPTPDGATGA